MIRHFVISLFCLALYTPCIAQLCDFIVDAIEICGQDPDGPVNPFDHHPFALFLFDVEDSDAKDINGHPILPMTDNYIVRPYENDDVYNAYATCESGSNAETITIYHPDFNNYKIKFSDYIGEQPLKGSNVYKIKIKIPSVSYIEAAKAYHNLDFAVAKKLFSVIADDPVAREHEKAVANTRLSTIDSLIIFKKDAERYEKLALSNNDVSERDRNLLRARLTYAKIFKRTGLLNAEVKVEEIRSKLLDETMLPHQRHTTNPSALNKLHVSAFLDGNNTNALGNDAVEYNYTSENGKKIYIAKSALLIFDIPFRDPKLESTISTSPLQIHNGEQMMYVKTVDTKGPIGETDEVFTLIPPEYTGYAPMKVILKELGLSQLLPNKVYRVNISVPSLIMQVANSNLSDLNFEAARNLYRSNFEDAKEYKFACTCLDFLDNREIIKAIKIIENESSPFNDYDMEWSRIITGSKAFSNLDERNRALVNVNSKLESSAKKLADAYQSIYNIGKEYGLELGQANQKYLDYKRIMEGVRNIPLIIVFREAKNKGDGKYAISSELTYQPSVALKFSDRNGNSIPFRARPIKVNDNRLNITLNNRISELFVKGEGKMEIIPAETTGKDSNGNKLKQYNSAKYDIKNLKIDDYEIVKLEVILSSN